MPLTQAIIGFFLSKFNMLDSPPKPFYRWILLLKQINTATLHWQVDQQRGCMWWKCHSESCLALPSAQHAPGLRQKEPRCLLGSKIGHVCTPWLKCAVKINGTQSHNKRCAAHTGLTLIGCYVHATRPNYCFVHNSWGCWCGQINSSSAEREMRWYIRQYSAAFSEMPLSLLLLFLYCIYIHVKRGTLFIYPVGRELWGVILWMTTPHPGSLMQPSSAMLQQYTATAVCSLWEGLTSTWGNTI